MTIKIVPTANGLFIPATSADVATSRSFGADDNRPMTSGANLAQWREFRDKTGVRVVKPS